MAFERASLISALIMQKQKPAACERGKGLKATEYFS